MQYSTLGSTGYKVSRLGFGAMRLPEKNEKVDRDLAVPMIRRAFEGGVNFIDSAVFYCHEDSQRAVGEALKGWREKIVVSTKNHYYGQEEKDWRTNLENSLERLGVEYIDIYNTHGVNARSLDENVRPRILKWLQKAKNEGLIRHICTSFHDNNDGLRKVVDCGIYESVILQYNMLDRQLEDGIAYAKEKNMGVIAMGPVGGGRLGTDTEEMLAIYPEVKRVPELALRFVLSNPNIDIALSGMSTIRQVEENIRTASDKTLLGDGERDLITAQLERLKQMADLYCTGCGYCSECPQEVNIPRIFEFYNRGRVYGLWDNARQSYKSIGNEWVKGNRSDACVECGKCEEKCPQRIPIMKQLKEAHEALNS